MAIHYSAQNPTTKKILKTSTVLKDVQDFIANSPDKVNLKLMVSDKTTHGWKEYKG